MGNEEGFGGDCGDVSKRRGFGFRGGKGLVVIDSLLLSTYLVITKTHAAEIFVLQGMLSLVQLIFDVRNVLYFFFFFAPFIFEINWMYLWLAGLGQHLSGRECEITLARLPMCH